MHLGGGDQRGAEPIWDGEMQEKGTAGIWAGSCPISRPFCPARCPWGRGNQGGGLPFLRAEPQVAGVPHNAECPAQIGPGVLYVKSVGITLIPRKLQMIIPSVVAGGRKSSSFSGCWRKPRPGMKAGPLPEFPTEKWG